MRRKLNLDIKKILQNRLKGVFKWLYPGIGIKRWIVLAFFGFLLVLGGWSLFRDEKFWLIQVLDITVIASGIIILILSIRRIIRSILIAFIPSSRNSELVDILYHRSQLGRGPRIVAVGGGTGLSVLLSGLKEYSSNITAIVTVADDGGSSGRLRQQFDILPPGDIRNCLVALADAPTLMQDLFRFRFDGNSEFSGHNFGNLFITVMTRLTGDFEKAIKETSKVLALRGQVIPSTLTNVVLKAEHINGSITVGETKIPAARIAIKRVFLDPEDAAATLEALKAIDEAQIIVLGPGSLYTSIIPNLLIRDITSHIVASEAIKVYVCNAMTQPGETENYRASGHVKTLVGHSGAQVFDYCVLNVAEIPGSILKRYAGENSYPVINDRKNIEAMGYRVIEDDIVAAEDNVIRHDESRLAKIILGLAEEI